MAKKFNLKNIPFLLQTASLQMQFALISWSYSVAVDWLMSLVSTLTSAQAVLLGECAAVPLAEVRPYVPRNRVLLNPVQVNLLVTPVVEAVEAYHGL